MIIPFTKMHGIGNDYIYVDCFTEELRDPGRISAAMSPRHFSVGADGLVMICRSDKADARMRMFNLDGSEGRMCGNAIRCVGKYLFDNGRVNKTEMSVETLSGIKYLKLQVENGVCTAVTVDMGKADFTPENIPVLLEKESTVANLEAAGKSFAFTPVSMGNPHAVIFMDSLEGLELEKIGPACENHPLFPQRVNTEFVEVIDSTVLKMRVWERGSGETYACGTGACAVVAAAVKRGICPKNQQITVILLGGELHITCKDDYRMMMEGPATKVYEGVYEYELQDQ